MEKLSCTRNGIGAFSGIARYALVVVMMGMLIGCGKAKPTATAKFCNILEKSSTDFTAYLHLRADGLDTTWYAYTGECSACASIPADKTLTVDFGDDETGSAFPGSPATTILDINGEYMFRAELDPDLTTKTPTVDLYKANGSYICEDLDPFES
jgi:hypothetical protein